MKSRSIGKKNTATNITCIQNNINKKNTVSTALFPRGWRGGKEWSWRHGIPHSSSDHQGYLHLSRTQNFKKEEVWMHALSVHLLKIIHTNNLAVKEESTNKNNKGNTKVTDNQVAGINYKESFLVCCRQKMSCHWNTQAFGYLNIETFRQELDNVTSLPEEFGRLLHLLSYKASQSPAP